jgi:tetratricopeptide (TPR) repeat protein
VLADYYAERGRALLLARDYPGAAAAARAALRSWDGYALARAVLGLALLELRRYDLAAREFDLYLEKGGRPTPDVFRARGHARMNLGDYLGAGDDYTRLLGLAPGAEAHAHRGWAYFFADAWRPALRDFEQALRLDPEYGDAYTGRGLARVMLGQYRPAVRDAEEALRRRPRDPAMLHNLACVFAQAVARAAADPAAPDRAALVAGYRTQAVAALRGALALVPPAQRQPFWRDKVWPDSALDPVRRSAEFEQLAREYASPARSR